MRPATTAALIALLALLIGAAVLQLVFKVGGDAPTASTTTGVATIATTTPQGAVTTVPPAAG